MNKNETKLVYKIYAGIWVYFSRIWDSVRLRAKRRKCIIAGCEIPARGVIGIDFQWYVCGIHRGPVSDVIAHAHTKRLQARIRAAERYRKDLVCGLNKLGCHEDELALAG